MRHVGWSLLILTALGWMAVVELDLLGPKFGSATLDAARTASTSPLAPNRSVWRHTRLGWQRRDRWDLGPRRGEPKLHPAVVATLELLLSLAALLVFSSSSPAATPQGRTSGSDPIAPRRAKSRKRSSARAR